MQTDPSLEILSGLDYLQLEFAEAVEGLKKRSSFLTDLDIRVTSLNKCFHVIQSTSLSMQLWHKYLCEDTWWAAEHPDIPLAYSRTVTYDFDRYHRLAFIDLLHSAIDSSMRTIRRTINKGGDRTGTGESANIYGFVLKQLGLNKYRGLLCIIRLMKNMSHNNGRHTEASVTLQFKGKTYPFEKDSEPLLFDWLRFIEITKEVKNLFLDIAVSDKISQVTIVDPNLKAIRDHHEKLYSVSNGNS